MAEIKRTFFQECDEQLAELERGLLVIAGGDRSPETVNAVFRAVHSIKGGAGAFGIEPLVRFAHAFETALSALRANHIAPDPANIRLFLRAADLLADLVRAAQDHAPEGRAEVDPAQSDGLAAELAALIGQAAAPPPEPDPLLDFQPVRVQPAAQTWQIRFRPHASLYAHGNDALVLLRELSRLGTAEITLDAARLPALDRLDPETACLAWTIDLTTDRPGHEIRDVFEFVESDCDLEITSAPQPAAATVAPVRPTAEEPSPKPDPAPPVPRTDVSVRPTIRVDLDRLDRLIDLVGELVINQAVLAQRIAESNLARSSAICLGLDELDHLTRDVQDSVMAIRAQPVKTVFQRLPRLVRELATITGKEVRIVTEGEATEVDNTVIERLSDPLTHMIRNAIDHGIETPTERIVASKPVEGTVRVAAMHRSGRIVIEVGDDGAGIDRERVLSVALKKRLVPAGAALSDDEIDNLILSPGFTTAPAVSDISGRGVGMDAVRQTVQSMGGRISITSEPGRGSTFSLSLPLTLAVLDGMVVGVEQSRFVVPLTAILETFQPGTARTHPFGRGLQLIAVRGTYVPLIDVGVALGFRGRTPDPAALVALLVEAENGARAALLVDVVHGQRQVVIKSLEANYRQVPGVAAATILGDGRVALILDVPAIVASSIRQAEIREVVDA